MTTKEIQKTGDIFIRIGQILNTNPQFLKKLENFLNLQGDIENQLSIDFEKINKIDLFQLIREKSEKEVNLILSEFSVKELREVLKKYHFGSPSTLKSVPQIIEYIIYQLRQRKTDVFLNLDHDKVLNEEKEIKKAS